MGLAQVSQPTALRRGATAGLLAVSAGLIAAYPFVPDYGRRLIYSAFACAVVVPIVLGNRRRPSSLRMPWLFLLAAMVLGAVSNTILRLPLERPPWLDVVATTMPSVASGFLLAATVGVVVLRGRNDLGGLVDAGLVALAFGGLLSLLVVLPRMQAGGASPGEQARLAVVLMLQAAILGALLRLLETDPARNPAVRLLLAALALNLTGFVLLGVLGDGGGRVAAMMAFMAAYVALGAAAAGSAIHRLAEPGPARDELGIARMLFLGAALSVIPVTVSVRSMFGHPISGPFLIVATVLVVPLVLVRIGLLTRDLHRSERALRHLAGHDPLTAALNRREFTAALGSELDRSRDLALIFCDLDSFKQINDQYGHVTGDRLLAEVADRLRTSLRETDLVCRYGGDEFLILLRDAGPQELQLIQNRIADALVPPFAAGSDRITISASFGAVISAADRREAITAEQLIGRADAAMYDDKRRPMVGTVH